VVTLSIVTADPLVVTLSIVTADPLVVTLYIAHSAIETTPQYLFHSVFGSGLQVYWFWSSGLLVTCLSLEGSQDTTSPV